MHKPPFDVMIAGEVNLDLILYGLPSVMPTERELLASNFVTTLGGSSSIVAHNLATLGSSVTFASLLGRDELGKIAYERLADSGVDLSYVRFHPEMLTGVTLLLPHGRERHILTYAGTIAHLNVGDLSRVFLDSGRHFHLASLFLQRGLQPGLPSLVRKLKRRGITFSMDTNDDPDDRWGGVLEELIDQADVLLPNRDEILRITHAATVDAALSALQDRVPLIVVKCGAEGAVLQEGSRRQYVPGIAIEPVDTIGAGDSFDAGFLHAWLRGASPEAAVRFGNITGALSTLRAGGTEAFREADLMRNFFAQHGAEKMPTAR